MGIAYSQVGLAVGEVGKADKVTKWMQYCSIENYRKLLCSVMFTVSA